MITAACETPSMGARLRAVTVLPLMVAGLSMGCTLPQEPIDARSTGDRAPLDSVTVNRATLRPASPAELGDADVSTDIRDPQAAGGSTLIGTSRLVADSIAAYPDPGDEVAFIRISVAAGIIPGTLLTHYPEARIVWTLGGVEETQVVDMLPLMSTESPTIGGDNFPTDLFIRTTDELATKPGGGAWTWADVLALEDVGIEVDYELPALQVGGAALGEVWIDVYSKVGSKPSIVFLQQSFASVRQSQKFSQGGS